MVFLGLKFQTIGGFRYRILDFGLLEVRAKMSPPNSILEEVEFGAGKRTTGHGVESRWNSSCDLELSFLLATDCFFWGTGCPTMDKRTVIFLATELFFLLAMGGLFLSDELLFVLDTDCSFLNHQLFFIDHERFLAMILFCSLERFLTLELFFFQTRTVCHQRQ